MNNDKKDYSILIAQKAERLITGLYLVTDLLDGEEPLKKGLRVNAIALLASINTLAQPEVKDRIREYKMSLKLVTETLSLLHVATTAGAISPMNGGLLVEGFRSLQLVLEKKQPLLTKEMLVIDNETMLAEVPAFTEAIVGTSYDALTPSLLKRTPLFSEKEIEAHVRVNTDVKDNIFYKRQSIKDNKIGPSNKEIASPVPMSMPSSFQKRKHSRKEQILALFVKGVDVGIKDISPRIRGCSEKTIQRELNNLVHEGSIERIGEKRWSRYILR